MACRILIVEDQPLIAMGLEDAVHGLGHVLVGIAACKVDALAWADETDVALVDVFLLDGPTGPEIGRILAQHGVSVLFMTGNPEELGDGITGTLGAISKPVLDAEAIEAIRYAVDRHEEHRGTPPARLVEFS
jgi:two-component system, response regulator PdtaR